MRQVAAGGTVVSLTLPFRSHLSDAEVAMIAEPQ
jgi:hypothetical protein